MDDSIIICRCEEVTVGDIKRAIRAGLVQAGDIRKYTRAGMGSCQGRTCQRLMMQIIKQYTGKTEAAEETVKTRIPAEQVSIRELSNWEEE